MSGGRWHCGEASTGGRKRRRWGGRIASRTSLAIPISTTAICAAWLSLSAAPRPCQARALGGARPVVSAGVRPPRAVGDVNTCVVRAGRDYRIEAKKPVRMGSTAQGARRTVFEGYRRIQLTPQDRIVAADLQERRITIRTSVEAAGRVYRAQLHAAFASQVYRRVGSRLKWVTVGHETRTERFTIVVDLPESPELRFAQGGTTTIALPGRARLVDVRSKERKVLELRADGNTVRCRALKTGRARIDLTYAIGGRELERRLRARVSARIAPFIRKLTVGETAEVSLREVEKQLKLKECRIVEISDDGVRSWAKAARQADRLDVHGLGEGGGKLSFSVVGRDRRKREHRVTLVVELTVQPALEPPSGGGGGAGGGGRVQR